MATYFYVTNDLRTNMTSIRELSGSLDGRYVAYNSTTNKFTDVSSTDILETDRIIPINIWNLNDTSGDNNYIVDDNAVISGSPTISLIVNSAAYHEVLNINIKRNRAFYQLFNCTSQLTLVEPLGYNAYVKLNAIDGAQLYAKDPLIYTMGLDGLATFYFSPDSKAGWVKCVRSEDYDKSSTPNPDYNENYSQALSPCDADGWRQVLNGKYFGFEFNFYPNGCTRWWTMVEGLGHNIKLRFLDSTGSPLLYPAWYPTMTINSGTGNYSLFGTYVGNVAKVEARFIE